MTRNKIIQVYPGDAALGGRLKRCGIENSASSVRRTFEAAIQQGMSPNEPIRQIITEVDANRVSDHDALQLASALVSLWNEIASSAGMGNKS